MFHSYETEFKGQSSSNARLKFNFSLETVDLFNAQIKNVQSLFSLRICTSGVLRTFACVATQKVENSRRSENFELSNYFNADTFYPLYSVSLNVEVRNCFNIFHYLDKGHQSFRR